MTAQIIVLSDYRKAKAEPKWVTYAEWLKFCDPYDFWGMQEKSKGDDR